jgi:hypothetical protein
VAVLEVVVRGPFVVGIRLLEHFVENAPTGGSSRFFAVSSGDEVISPGFTLALLVLLLVVASFGAPVGALGFLVLVLPLILVTTKDGTNCLLNSGIVGDDIHQLVGSGGGVVAQLSDKLFASGSREESHDDVRIGDVGKLSALFGETPDIVMERLVRLLFTTLEVPTVARAHVGPLEVSLKHSHQIIPVVDLSKWEILEPCSSGVQ